MKIIYSSSFLVLLCTLMFSCKKGQGPALTNNQQEKSIYADSIFYIQNTNQLIKPIISTAGTYTSLPEGLDIDKKTGFIDLSKSETGLKYSVTFTSAESGATQSSLIVVSGINYYDKIYNLSAGDSIAEPIYNANSKLPLPNTGLGNLFDENGGCKKAGITIDAVNAKINLAQSVRNQAIDTGATEQVKLTYRINDNSDKALNGINVKIYFYRTVKEIPQYLTDLLNDRKTLVLNNAFSAAGQTSTQSMMSIAAKAPASTRPRPPCIIVVSR